MDAPPPSRTGNLPVKLKRMVIDSRSRDATAYPTPARYEVQLHEDLFNVMAVNLVIADVPFPAYLVGANRCSVPFSFALPSSSSASSTATINATAQIPVGDYEPADLAIALGEAMTAAAGAAAASAAAALEATGEVPTFAGAYDARKDAFSVTSSAGAFALLFGGRATDTPAKVLGFGVDRDFPAWPTTGNTYTAVAPYRCDFRKDRFLVLKLSPNAEVITSVTQAIDRTFAVVPASQEALNINVDADGFEKRWSPPLSRVGRLMVHFTDADGLPYDFQNQDHRLELVFELVGQPFLFPTAFEGSNR